MAKKLSTATKLTNEYVRLSARQEVIANRMAEIKTAIIAEHPEGVKTDHGTWQVFADGTRLTYETKNIQGIIDGLILEGNGHIAERLLKIRKESTTSGGVRFVKIKGQ